PLHAGARHHQLARGGDESIHAVLGHAQGGFRFGTPVEARGLDLLARDGEHGRVRGVDGPTGENLAGLLAEAVEAVEQVLDPTGVRLDLGGEVLQGVERGLDRLGADEPGVSLERVEDAVERAEFLATAILFEGEEALLRLAEKPEGLFGEFLGEDVETHQGAAATVPPRTLCNTALICSKVNGFLTKAVAPFCSARSMSSSSFSVETTITG